MNKQRKEGGGQEYILPALNPASFHYVAGIACFLLLLCLSSLTTRGADTLYVGNMDLMIARHDTLFCAGDILLINEGGRVSSIDNNGHIVLKNNFHSTVPRLFEKTSLAEVESRSGNLHFVSADTSFIELIEPGYLYNVDIRQTALYLLSPLTIIGVVSLDTGKIDQQGHNMLFYEGEGDFIIYGKGIQLENNLNYIYNSHDSGYLEFKHLTNPYTENLCNGGFLFYNLGSDGEITLRRYNYPYPVAFPVLNRHFELEADVTGENMEVGFTWFDSLFVDPAAQHEEVVLWHKMGRFPHPYPVVTDTLQQVYRARVNLLDGVYAIAAANCDFPYQSTLPDSQVICLGEQSRWHFHAGIPDEEQTSYQYTWSADVPLLSADSSSAILSLPDSLLGDYAGQLIQLKLNIMDTMGCWMEDSVLLHVRKPQDMALLVADDEGQFRSNFCQRDTLLLLDTFPKSVPGTYTWKTGDGNIGETSQAQMPHHYAQHGRYHIEAYFTDRYACVSHATYAVQGALNIHPQPELHALFSEKACTGDSWIYQSQPWVDPSPFYSQILYYQYELDGEGSSFDVRHTQEDPGVFRHVFDQPGVYEFFHRVESNAGCYTDTIISLTVHPALSLSLDTSSLATVCQHTNIILSLNNPDDTQIQHVEWTINDTLYLTDNLYVQWHTDQVGEHHIHYSAEDQNGCRASGDYSVSVLHNPYPEIYSLKGKNGSFDYCVGEEVALMEVSDHDYPLVYWVHGDDTLSGSSFLNVYHRAGNYPVAVHVESDNTCQNAAFDTLRIWEEPASAIAVQAVCLNEQKYQAAISFENRLPDESFVFDFGDGYFSTSPEHRYDRSGEYVLRVAMEKPHVGFSCERVVFDTVRILPLPYAGFSIRDSVSCVQDSIHFLYYPQVFSQLLEKIVWHIDEETYLSSAESNGYAYLPEEEGMLHITQEVFNAYGCVSSYASQQEVFPSPDFLFETWNLCFGEELQTSLVHTGSADGHRRTRWQLMEADHIVERQEGDYFAFTPAAPGLYDVLADVSNQYACSRRKQKTVEVFPLPQVNILSDFTTCDSVYQHVIDSQYVVHWHDGLEGHERFLDESGKYGYMVQDTVTGCVLADSFSIILATPLQFALEERYEACGQAVVDPGLPFFYTYNWSDGSEAHRKTISRSGLYSLTVTDFSGCTAIASFDADIISIPELHISDTFYCEGSELLLEVPASDAMIWSTGDTTRQLTINTPGDYSVTAINGERCELTRYFVVQERLRPNPGLQDTLQQCGNDPLQLSAAFGMNSYKWHDGLTGRSRWAEESGLYIIEVQDAWACTGKDTTVVHMHPMPEIVLEDAKKLCDGAATLLDLSEHKKVRWNDGDTMHIKQIEKAGTYYVWVENEQACKARSNDMSVTLVPMPVAVLPDTMEACNRIVLDAKNIGATYRWSSGEKTRKIEAATTAFYSVRISYSEQCFIEDSAYLVVLEAEKPDLGDNFTLCRGELARLYDRRGIAAGYQWNNRDTTPAINVYRAGVYSLQLTHANGCLSRDSIEIALAERESLSLGDEVILCEGDQLLMAPEGDFDFYEWGDDRGYLSHSQSLHISKPGRYWLTAVNAAGCPSHDTVNVRSTDLSFTPLFVVASDVRVGEAVQFRDLSSPPQGLHYRWDFGDATVSYNRDPLHTFYRPDTFQVIMHVNNGVCFKTFSKPVLVQGYLKNEQEINEEFEETELISMIQILQAQVYPNPFDNYLNMEVELSGKADIRYYLFDSAGRLLYAGKKVDVEALYQTLFVGCLQPGMYVLKIVAGTSHEHFKLIK